MHPLLSEDIQERFRAEGHWRGETAAEVVSRRAAANPDLAAIVGEPHLTYRQLDEAAARLAGGLRSIGLTAGDAVVAPIPCDWRAIVLTVACSRLGVGLAPLWTRATAAQTLRAAQRLGARALVLPPGSCEREDWRGPLAEPDADSPLEHLLTWPEADRAPGTTLKVHDFDDLVEQGPPETGFHGNAAAPSVYVSTGGTTGEPKLVMQTEDALLYTARVSADLMDLAEGEVYACVGPFGHVLTNVFGILRPLVVGAAILPLPDWDARRCGELIRTWGAAATLVSSTHVFDWMQLGDDAAELLRPLRVIGSGGKPDDFYDDAARQFDTPIVRCFGMSEAPGNLTTRPTDPADVRATEGIPYVGFEHVVVDPMGEPCAPCAPGELLVRGPSLFHGYLGRPEATAEAVTADGFYRSGDLFVHHANGGFSCVGRLKDLIRRGHNNIDPGEIESALLQHSSIDEACVVGVTDRRLSELIAAVVVLKGPAPTLDELKAHLLEHGLAKGSLPDRLEVVASLPRTSVGKYDKRVVRLELESR